MEDLSKQPKVEKLPVDRCNDQFKIICTNENDQSFKKNATPIIGGKDIKSNNNNNNISVTKNQHNQNISSPIGKLHSINSNTSHISTPYNYTPVVNVNNNLYGSQKKNPFNGFINYNSYRQNNTFGCRTTIPPPPPEDDKNINNRNAHASCKNNCCNECSCNKHHDIGTNRNYGFQCPFGHGSNIMTNMKPAFPGMKPSMHDMKAPLPCMNPPLLEMKPQLTNMKPPLPGMKTSLLDTKLPLSGMKSPLIDMNHPLSGMKSPLLDMKASCQNKNSAFQNNNSSYQSKNPFQKMNSSFQSKNSFQKMSPSFQSKNPFQKMSPSFQNKNLFQNLKSGSNSSTTRNINTNETHINRFQTGFQQHMLQAHGSNNFYIRSSMLDKNNISSNDVVAPFCRNRNLFSDSQNMFQGTTCDMLSSKQSLMRNQRSQHLNQSPNYRRMSVHERNDCSTRKPIHQNFFKVTNNKSFVNYRGGNYNFRGSSNFSYNGNSVKSKYLKVHGSLKKNQINASEKISHKHLSPNLNRSTSSAPWKYGFSYCNGKKKNLYDDNNNYFNSPKEHFKYIEDVAVTNNTEKNSSNQFSKYNIECSTTNDDQAIGTTEDNGKLFCDICLMFVRNNMFEEHEKEHVTCPIDNCNDVYNVEDLEYHLLSHVKKNNDHNILNDPEEIKRWVEERKKNYPLRKNIRNVSTGSGRKKETAYRGETSGKKKPNCLIEELLFENYCSAIGKHIMQKTKNEKSLFLPALTELSKTNPQSIDGKEYYSYFDYPGENTDNLRQKITQNHSNNDNNKTLESLNVHKTPPLLYNLMRDDIQDYEQKLMSCIKYVTENNFFDENEEQNIVEMD